MNLVATQKSFEEKLALNSAELEVALLGLCLIDKDIFLRVNQLLKVEDFLNINHQKVYEAIKRVAEQSGEIDVYLITSFLKDAGFLEAIGGIEALNFLMANAGYRANIDTYIKKQLNISNTYQLASLLRENYQRLLKEEDFLAVSNNISLALLQLGNSLNLLPYQSAESVVKKVLRDIESINEFHAFSGLETGFITLDKYTLGLNKGDFIIIAARPSMGKTAFALNIATNVARSGTKKVLIFSLEMTNSQIMHRIVSSLSRINSFKIRTAALNESEWGEIYKIQEDISSWKLFLNDQAGINLEEIVHICRNFAQNQGVDLIIVDYLQLISMSSSIDYEGRQFEVSRISRTLKQLARELKVPLIALSQLSRQVEKREDKIPLMSDLRESGTIEQDADLVLFLHRPDYYNKDRASTSGASKTNLIVSKNRNGPTGFIEIIFLPEFGSFEDPSIFKSIMANQARY